MATTYKINPRLYFTAQTLHKYKPELSIMCFRCGIVEGSFLDCTWSCTKPSTFWYDFCDIMTKFTGFTFSVDSQICLLGNLTTISANLRNFQKKFLEIASCIARRCIAMTWKSDSHLLIARWVFGNAFYL